MLRALLLALLALTSTADATDSLKDGEIVQVGAARQEGPRVFYVNGVATAGDRAIEQARAVSKALETGVELVYVDCADLEIDWLATVVSKVGDFGVEINAAADVLAPLVLKEIRAGTEVVLVGYSLGGAVIQNVVSEVAGQLSEAEHAGALSRMSVVLLGAACFAEDHPLSDGWPRGLGGLFAISDARDPIARWWGDIDDDWFPCTDERHSLDAVYLRHLTRGRLWQTGRLVVDGPEVLLEEVRASRQPSDRLVRWRIWDMPDQESRRSINGVVPTDWARVRWEVGDHAVRESVRFSLLEDNALWPDESVADGVRSETVLEARAFDYIGRVETSREELRDGFSITARPAP